MSVAINKSILPGFSPVSKAITLQALPPVYMDSDDDIEVPLDVTYSVDATDLDDMLGDLESEPTLVVKSHNSQIPLDLGASTVEKALKDIHAKLDALENDHDDGVVEMDEDDEPVEKANRAVKYLRRFKKGNRWVYIYKNAKGHVNGKHLPEEGHKFGAGDAIHTGDTMHRVKDATDTHVTTVDEHGKEHTHTHDELRKKAHDGHKDAIEAHKKHGHEQRKKTLEAAEKSGHAPTIKRAKNELDRFAGEHGIASKSKEEEQHDEFLRDHDDRMSAIAKTAEGLSEWSDAKDIRAAKKELSDIQTNIQKEKKRYPKGTERLKELQERAEKIGDAIYSAENKRDVLHVSLNNMRETLDDVMEDGRGDPDAERETLKEQGFDQWDIADYMKFAHGDPNATSESKKKKEKDSAVDLYGSIGIEQGASADEIKAAYRKAALENHPDKGGDPETIKKINAAYDILKDPELREKYHETGDLKAVQRHAIKRSKKALSRSTVLASIGYLLRRQ